VNLSIVIPTYNRAKKVENLVNTLSSMFSSLSDDFAYEIIISDNHSYPAVNKDLTNVWGINCRIISPDNHLLTAEENLLFAIGSANGTYCWVLGDDDVPISEGVAKLQEIVLSNKYDLVIFNSLTLNQVSQRWDNNRLKLNRIIEEMELVDFIKRAGFWSLPAGFSTLLFKREMYDQKFMKELHEKDLKIYSHVTSLLYAFHKKCFAAVSIPLVKYSTNPFDNDSPTDEQKSKHWVLYAKNQECFFRDPWTYSFLKQISELDSKEIFSVADLAVTIDQGHLGQKFFLLDAILGFIVDQLVFERQNPTTRRMSTEQFEFCLAFLSKLGSPWTKIIEEISSLSQDDDSLKDLEYLRAGLFSPDRQLLRRKVYDLANGMVIHSAYGYSWSPFHFDLNIVFSSLSQTTNVIQAESMVDLECEIQKFIEKNPFYMSTYLPNHINIGGLNSMIIKFDRISKLIPKSIRKVFPK
jgi:glycosyltransferase involved in cell wall biosynthesis